jgi:hypothetical protein
MKAVMEAPNQSLRLALDLPDGFDSVRHGDEVETIRRAHPHGITFKRLPIDGNCITFALGLTDDPEYRRAEVDTGGKLARAKFVRWLLGDRLHELTAPKPGALVFYFRDDAWQHMGVVQESGRVQSMWGTFPVYEHDLWEVPARYGSEVRFFDMPEEGAALGSKLNQGIEFIVGA